MLNDTESADILSLLKAEIVPALGCTEPVAVALAVAHAHEALGCAPEHVEVFVSGNIYKNGMGVGIPNSGGKTGLEIAGALSCFCGVSDYELEVLRDVNAQAIKSAEQFINDGKFSLKVKENVAALYVDCVCSAADSQSRVIISHRHTNVIYIEKDGEVLFRQSDEANDSADQQLQLSVSKIYAFATEIDIDSVRFLLDGADMNQAIAQEGLNNDYGLRAGKTVLKNISAGLLADDLYTACLSLTAAASDARMDGCALPVMTNSGSGNQGITTFLPVVAAAKKADASEETLIRALVLSNLIAIYIKQFVGQLTALCGVSISACGASCGITYLFGGGYQQISNAIKNMAGSIMGMICDGAKQGCALKVSSAVASAVHNALLALDNIEIRETDGIIDKSVDQTIRNIGAIGAQGMRETDQLILQTMLNKNKR